MHMGLKPIKTLVQGCTTWGSRKGYGFSLGLHTTVFHTEIYAIKGCVMENVEKGYKGRNKYMPYDRQVAIKALENFQVY
jgi:hypothetical protein